MNAQPAPDPSIGFAQKLLTLLDEGARSTSYKLAALLALIDCCIEYAGSDGLAPTTITTTQLAEKVIELYWPQTSMFAPSRPGAEAMVLRQSHTGQAEIIGEIIQARTSLGSAHAGTLSNLQKFGGAKYDALRSEIEWKLVEMPLPRLQRFGKSSDSFIYTTGWDDKVRRSEVRNHDFDNRLFLKPGAGDHLLRLAPLLRPLIQREWTRMVAGWNRSVVEEMRLEEFLFGVDRVSTAPLVPALKDVQENCCFYCHHKITGKPQIDHFLPWSRHPDNGIENLVLSDRTCNANKRDLLASAEFVGAWALRFDEAEEIGQYLATAAVETGWERHPHRTLGAARALYLHLPDGTKLWAGRNKFTDADPAQLQKALAS